LKGKAPIRAPTARESPSSNSSDASEDEDDGDKEAMLAALQAHSRAMFGLDGPDEAESSTQALRRLSPTRDEDDGDEFQSDDGWGADDGFVSDSEAEGEDEDEEEDDMEVKPMKTVDPVRPRVVEVVDDSTGRGGNLDVLSKAEKRAFLVRHHLQTYADLPEWKLGKDDGDQA
jgi:hypothetical protein